MKTKSVLRCFEKSFNCPTPTTLLSYSAALVSKGYEPVLERQLIAFSEDPAKARKFTRFVGLLQEKPPETESEWEEFMSAWEDACRYKPNFG